jgi:hypothetical protein
MSSIPNGGANIFIAANTSGNWFVRWNNSGWQGNTLVESQPLNTGANMVNTPGSIDLDSSGRYTFWTNIRNAGPNSTFFNLQVSSN